jgi:hypothetical protein
MGEFCNIYLNNHSHTVSAVNGSMETLHVLFWFIFIASFTVRLITVKFYTYWTYNYFQHTAMLFYTPIQPQFGPIIQKRRFIE